MNISFDGIRKSAFGPVIECAGWILLLLVTVAVTVLRFRHWEPTAWYGDDLANLLAYRDGVFATNLFSILSGQEIYAEKFRPVFASVMAILFRLFELNLRGYQWVNLLIHACDALIVFALVRRLGRGNLLFALICTLAVALSRFGLYQVTQVTGLLEALALTFFLLTVYCVVRLFDAERDDMRWAWMALGMAALCMHTHERYIVLAPWLFLVFATLPLTARWGWRKTLILMAACIALPVLHILYKKFVVGLPFLVGTGGSRIAIDPQLIRDSWKQAIMSIFGLNTGPDYLVGMSIGGLKSSVASYLARTMAACWMGLMVWGIARRRAGDKPALQRRLDRAVRPFLLLMLGVLVLVPPTMTTHLEQRWLLAPYIVLLLLAAWALGTARARARLPSGMLSSALACVIVLSMMFVDSRFVPYFDRIFLVRNADFAAAVKRDVVAPDPAATGALGFLASSDNCGWALLDGDFFRIYGAGRRVVRCFDTLDAATRSTTLPQDARLFAYDAGRHRLQDVSAEFRATQRLVRTTTPAFDFLTAMDSGAINSTLPVGSPTGQGVFAATWPSPLGGRQTLTVISGFSYRFDNVLIPAGAELHFDARMIFPARLPTRAVVRIADQATGPWTTLYSRDLAPPAQDEEALFRSVTVPLEAFAGKRVSITFAAEMPGPDTGAHWIGFADPRIVVAGAAP